MSSKMLSNDLKKLQEKYSKKANYFDKKINQNYDPNKDKILFRQYEYCMKALQEVTTLITIQERTFK